MNIMKTNGVHLHYQECGAKTGRPLVFANSLGTDFRVWQALLPLLGDGFRVLLYDKRGHGLSDSPPPPYQIEDHVEDLAGLMRALGFEGAVVCGLSVGGLIAQGLAASHPDLVRGLILSDTAHKIGPPEIWSDRIKALQEGGIEALATAILERWFSEDFRTHRSAELAGWRHMLVRTPLSGYIGTALAIRDADMTAAAQSIQVPTLCLVGSEDGATPPELVRSMAALISGSQFHVIDGAGHLPCVEEPGQMARLVLTFLKESGLD
ncbi:MAG: 3-oxoadipate enol-lactonase [Rhodospirillales bacterium]|nr:3-oxoadipate enol-lactonase [Rhodospirillales bacterium]